MKIAEIYLSKQGEGIYSGKPSVFVRTSGCNLRCWFCDTPFTSHRPEGDNMAVKEILEQVEGYRTKHVVVTGGEPLLFDEIVPFTVELRTRGYHVTVETAGTLYLPVACDLMSISPKLSNSLPQLSHDAHWRERHEAARYAPDVLHKLMSDYDYQLKFVVDQPRDLQEVLTFLKNIPVDQPDRVWLMPQGVQNEELEARRTWLEPFCNQHGFHFCPRYHIEWFGHARGT